MKRQPEGEAMAQLARGDERAFKRLRREYGIHVMNVIAARLLGTTICRSDWDEVYELVWTKVWENASHYRPTAPFSAYVGRIASHACIDRVRALRNDSEQLGDWHEWSDEGYELEALMLVVDLDAMGRSLTPRQAKVLWLDVVEGLSREEIVQRLLQDGEPGTITSVTQVVAAARKKFRGAL